jgi:ribosomal RNA assembly protein
MFDYVLIPDEKLKLLKSDKKIFEKLENLCACKFHLSDVVEVDCEDPLKSLRVKEVVKAFGRGFDIEDCLNLLDEDYALEIIEVPEFSGKSKNRQIELKGRVIGKEGKSKNLIEKYAEVKLAIYGKTISIIGKWDRVRIAREAVEMLLSGRLHGTVYRFLESQMR